MPRFNISKAVGCSEYLIWILMNQHGGVTHPEYADAIADYLGATEEERDSIVAPQHRGTWKPNPKRKYFEEAEEPVAWNAKAVFVIDSVGDIIARYKSVDAAANRMRVEPSFVSRRCNRALGPKTNEFTPYGFTFRFEDDWKHLSPEERRNDIQDHTPYKALNRANPGEGAH